MSDLMVFCGPHLPLANKLEGKWKVALCLVAPSRRRPRDTEPQVFFGPNGPLLETIVSRIEPRTLEFLKAIRQKSKGNLNQTRKVFFSENHKVDLIFETGKPVGVMNRKTGVVFVVPSLSRCTFFLWKSESVQRE